MRPSRQAQANLGMGRAPGSSRTGSPKSPSAPSRSCGVAWPLRCGRFASGRVTTWFEPSSLPTATRLRTRERPWRGQESRSALATTYSTEPSSGSHSGASCENVARGVEARGRPVCSRASVSRCAVRVCALGRLGPLRSARISRSPWTPDGRCTAVDLDADVSDFSRVAEVRG